MKRAKQLGNVVFQKNSLFVKEEMEGSKVMAEMKMTSAGTHVVYEVPITTPYITLDSGMYGWIDDSQRQELIDMWNNIGSTYTLTYTDNTTDTVRMAREKRLVITPLYEGCDTFTAVIPLAKV